MAWLLLPPAITAAKVVLYVVSKESAISNAIKGELSLARNKGIPVLPIRIDETEIPDEINVLLGYPTYLLIENRDQILTFVRGRAFMEWTIGSNNETLIEHTSMPLLSSLPLPSIATFNQAWEPAFEGTFWVAATSTPTMDEAQNGGDYHFRRRFALPCEINDISSAELMVQSDDSSEIFLNERRCGGINVEDSKRHIQGRFDVKSFILEKDISLLFKVRNRTWAEIQSESPEPLTRVDQNPYGLNFLLRIYYRSQNVIQPASNVTYNRGLSETIKVNDIVQEKKILNSRQPTSFSSIKIEAKPGRIIAGDPGIVVVPLLFTNLNNEALYIDNSWLQLTPEPGFEIDPMEKFYYDTYSDTAWAPIQRPPNKPDFVLSPKFKGTLFVGFKGQLTIEQRNTINQRQYLAYVITCEIDGNNYTFYDLKSKPR